MASARDRAALAIANASLDALATLGASGASYSRGVLKAFQNTWNANYGAAFPFTDPTVAAHAAVYVPLVADGVYGPKTMIALAATMPRVPAPPVTAATFPTWWRVNKNTVTTYLRNLVTGLTGGGSVRDVTGGVSSADAAIAAAQARVPDTTGSTGPATGAVDSGGAGAVGPIEAGRQTAPYVLPTETIVGHTGVVQQSFWPWVVGGLAVVTFASVVGYFAFSKHGKKSWKV